MVRGEWETIIDDHIGVGFKLIFYLKKSEVGGNRHLFFIHSNSNIYGGPLFHKNKVNG
jgi:hypothetical protein